MDEIEPANLGTAKKQIPSSILQSTQRGLMEHRYEQYSILWGEKTPREGNMFFRNPKSFIVRFVLILVLLGGALGATQVQAQSAVYRVTVAGASDPGCGGSWSNPCDLQYALTDLAAAGDEIWVAAGTYKPTPDVDRTVSFTLKNGVAVYGGFIGTETLRNQRAPQTNQTILSGDLGIEGDHGDNSYHVVVGSNTDHSAVLDGFTVTAGNADPDQMERGGGMLNENGSPTVTNVIFSGNTAGLGGGMYNGGACCDPVESNPVLTNVIFDGNSAIEGGGMENQYNSSPSLTGVTFNNNSAIRSGGGMVNYDNSSPTLTDVTFNGNAAGAGGGMMNWNNSSPTLTRVTFSLNSASGWGGGVANFESSPILTNVTFYGNSSAEYGGGMSNESSSSPSLINVTISGNSAVTYGGGIYNDTEGVAVHNSILYGNSGGEIYDYSGIAIVTNSIVQGGYPGAGNLDVDPQLGSLQDNGGVTETMALDADSPAVDAGDANCPDTDQRGVTRPQGAACDLGAYEAEVTAGPGTTTVRVVSSAGMPLSGKPVYAFDGSTYTGYNKVTDAGGEAALTLPAGDYRFRVDVDGTQFWSGAENHCQNCSSVVVTIPEPVLVTVLDTDGMPSAGLNVYAFNGTTYTGFHGVTGQNGQVSLRLREGAYRFRADLNSTQFWSGAFNHCDVPGCVGADITVSKPVTVTVLDTDGAPKSGLNVYAFNGSTYTGYGKTTNADGQAIFTLPLGSYRFRADLNGTQFWSEASNHCDVPGCASASVTVSKPVIVTVLDTNEAPKAGLKVYAFNGSTYTGYSKTTNTDGLAIFTLPLGSYRFRADLNGTQFWSGASNHCEIPGCDSAQAIVTIPVAVMVQDGGGAPKSGVNVYAFNGSTYTGYSKVSGASGQAIFILPLGSYRFRADYSGTQYWSGSINHCSLPGCLNASVTVGPTISVTTIIIAASPNPSRVGEAIASTVTVSSASGTPEGEVTFSFEGMPIPGCLDQPLTNGVFTCDIRFFMTGDLRVSFTPSDGTAYSPAEAMEQHTVVAADVDVTVFDNPPFSLPGVPVAVNARVRNIYDVGGVYIIPAGSVMFTNDEGDSCTDDLDTSGYASCNLIFNFDGRYRAVYISIDGLHNSGFGTGSHPVLIYTATPTNTPSPTPIATQTATPTFTPTFTPTVASTPVTGCNSIRDYFLALPPPPPYALEIPLNYTMSLDIPNPNPYPVEIGQVFVAWNGASGHRVHPAKTQELRLMSVALNGILWEIPSPGQGGSSFTMHAPFSTPAVIPPGGATLTFTFDKTYNRPNGQELINISFSTPGCEAFPFTVTR
jgi:hypothetical protein